MFLSPSGGTEARGGQHGNGNKGNGPVAEVDERVHIHGGGHGDGGRCSTHSQLS